MRSPTACVGDFLRAPMGGHLQRLTIGAASFRHHSAHTMCATADAVAIKAPLLSGRSPRTGAVPAAQSVQGCLAVPMVRPGSSVLRTLQQVRGQHRRSAKMAWHLQSVRQPSLRDRHVVAAQLDLASVAHPQNWVSSESRLPVDRQPEDPPALPACLRPRGTWTKFHGLYRNGILAGWRHEAGK